MNGSVTDPVPHSFVRIALPGELRRFCQRQVYGHRRMIRDAIFHGIIQLAHCYREMWRESVALALTPRVLDERLDENPVDLELPYKATVVAGERIGGSKAFSASLAAVCEGAAL